MTNLPKEQIELINSIKNAIRKIQDNFDSYQNKCFTQRSPEFFCLELNGEAGELANLEKKHWKGKPIEHEKFSDEAADVLIALFNYCNARGINLEKAVIDKLNRIEEKRSLLESVGEKY